MRNPWWGRRVRSGSRYVAAIDRLVVLHGGRFIAQGDPQSVIRSPEVADIYLGIAADA